MGCKGSKQTEVESTYGELNKNTQCNRCYVIDIILANRRMVSRLNKWDAKVLNKQRLKVLIVS